LDEVEKIKKDHKIVDCYDALKLVLKSEMPDEFKEVVRNSKDNDGNFSATFTIEYLAKHKKWEAFGYYAEQQYEDFIDRKKIIEEDLIMGLDGKGNPFYKAGTAIIPVKEIVPRSLADSLLRQLTIERGYGIGIQRDGIHCYTLVQDGLFEIHSDVLPIGYPNRKSTLTPIDLHRGKYYATSSLAIFAFPPKE